MGSRFWIRELDKLRIHRNFLLKYFIEKFSLNRAALFFQIPKQLLSKILDKMFVHQKNADANCLKKM